MADLKNLGDGIRTLLRQLNGRQKATLLALGAVILVPLLWLSVRSTDESWLAVRNGAQLEPADLSTAEQTLRDSGLTSLRVEGERLFVPAEKVALADAALTAAGIAAPQDQSDEPTSSIFTPFQPAGVVERESQNQLHRNIERALTTIAGIQNATVISSRSKPARWGQKPEVDAAVYVSPSSGSRLTPELRASICASVARMIPDLVPERIVVTDQSTGRSWTPNANGTTAVDEQELAEQYEDSIVAALTWIPKAEVRVSFPRDFAPAVPEAGPPRNPVGARSRPNQAGAVAAGNRPQSVLVDIVVPNELSDSERVIQTAERALPFGIVAKVTVSEKPAALAAGGLLPEESRAGTQVIPGLALAVILISVVLAWRLRNPPTPPAVTNEDDVANFEARDCPDGDEPELIPVTELISVTAAEDRPITQEPAPALAVRPQPRFTFLQQTGPRKLYRLLAGEHPQTLALVLRHLPTTLATDVVSLLPSGIQSEVIRRIAEADLTGADVVEELEETLRVRSISTPATAATDTPTAPLPTMTRQQELLSPMERFEEIVKLTPPNLKRVVEEVEESLWADALHESSETLRFRVIASLPPQQARAVRARLGQSAPQNKDVEKTRNRIVETVNALRLPNDVPPLRHEFVA